MVRNYEAVAQRPQPRFAASVQGAVLAGFHTIAGQSSELVPEPIRTALTALGTGLQQAPTGRPAARQARARATARVTPATRRNGRGSDRARAATPDGRAREPRGR